MIDVMMCDAIMPVGLSGCGALPSQSLSIPRLHLKILALQIACPAEDLAPIKVDISLRKKVLGSSYICLIFPFRNNSDEKNFQPQHWQRHLGVSSETLCHPIPSRQRVLTMSLLCIRCKMQTLNDVARQSQLEPGIAMMMLITRAQRICFACQTFDVSP
jgi:hypothetical protein